MHRFFIALSTAALVSCTHQADVKVSAPLSGEGKPAAPAEVTAELTPTHARLTVRFEADAEQASVAFSALDGLTLTLVPEASPRAYKQGEATQLDVDYTGASGTLVVNVAGTFNGAKKNRVVTFAVGEVKPVSGGTKVTPDNGPGFKALPSGQ
ncbi:MAG: hypothetical protein Q8L48_00075 [Archangium sp.]|nr:hypothetical protein [Archangium sp.]